MMPPQDGTPVHISMINYFTRFSDNILQHTIDFKKIIAKPTCFKELTVFSLALVHGGGREHKRICKWDLSDAGQGEDSSV